MQEENSKQITVKLRKAGWEVEITCSESQLKQAIENVLSALETSVQGVSAGSEACRANNSGHKTCKGLILDLWEDSWFAQERALSEVHEEIARRGYHYDRTAVSHSLRELVIENVLTREGNMRNYTYIQKRPPGRASAPTAESGGEEK